MTRPYFLAPSLAQTIPIRVEVTSAWIEFFRDTGSRACEMLTESLRSQTVMVTDPIMLEVLSGAPPHEDHTLLRLLSTQHYEAIAPRIDWLDAAHIHRACRHEGVTIRSQLDCLLAAFAIRAAVPVLHHDRDFDGIAAHSRLTVI